MTFGLSPSLTALDLSALFLPCSKNFNILLDKSAAGADAEAQGCDPISSESKRKRNCSGRQILLGLGTWLFLKGSKSLMGWVTDIS